MPQQSSSFTVYTCDSCGNEIELEGAHGLAAPFPTGWLTVQPAPPTADVFCSWACLGEYATAKAEAAAARSAKRGTS